MMFLMQVDKHVCDEDSIIHLFLLSNKDEYALLEKSPMLNVDNLTSTILHTTNYQTLDKYNTTNYETLDKYDIGCQVIYIEHWTCC